MHFSKSRKYVHATRYTAIYTIWYPQKWANSKAVCWCDSMYNVCCVFGTKLSEIMSCHTGDWCQKYLLICHMCDFELC